MYIDKNVRKVVSALGTDTRMKIPTSTLTFNRASFRKIDGGGGEILLR